MKENISTVNAPAAIGPYSQAILSNNTLYISGQIPLNPTNGELVSTGIEGETAQCMKNIEAILTAAEMTFEQVVKATIFIRDMGQFSLINAVYSSYFDGIIPPARETVEVSRLPKDVNIEISMIAVR
ncbi:Rid family detoxifying hydrolase [Eudoraea chungangensis]|uniref:Rid family detoxifying hydrolase n=1 Tax=Eudoraea chungangensis TaxID=1481905 RepID=UPI0023EDF247|nr:Rid family detoxifying hydrolase [Eudoraea chungangensis]